VGVMTSYDGASAFTSNHFHFLDFSGPVLDHELLLALRTHAHALLPSLFSQSHLHYYFCFALFD